MTLFYCSRKFLCFGVILQEGVVPKKTDFWSKAQKSAFLYATDNVHQQWVLSRYFIYKTDQPFINTVKDKIYIQREDCCNGVMESLCWVDMMVISDFNELDFGS